MQPESVATKRGLPGCRAGDILLHSEYDPEREALRFLAERLGDARPACVVLGGPCLDYLAPALRGLSPATRVVRVQYHPWFDGRETSEADASWSPSSPLHLEAFLDAAIDEDALAGLVFVEWPPAALAFPAASAACREALRSSLDRLASSGATVRASGRRWVANTLRHFLLVESLAELEGGLGPVLVAAAGPSLGEGLAPCAAALAERPRRLFVVAVSSALAALRARGVEPDLVVATDGGFWSRAHLYPLAARGAFLASPLSALPSACLAPRASLLLIDQGDFPERELAAFLGGGLRLPSHGTVAGTALRLASTLSPGPLLAAGFDFAARGLARHVAPHGFDLVDSPREGRLAPGESSAWSRAAEEAPRRLAEAPWRDSRSLEAYAGALDLELRALGRVSRLAPSPVPLAGCELPAPEDLVRRLARVEGRPPVLAARPAPPARLRLDFLASRLPLWRAAVADAVSAIASGAAATAPGLAGFLRAADLPAWASLRKALLRGAGIERAASLLAERASGFLDELEARILG